ncbi:cryptochrome/photolyase family protein [Persicirhabdus sediminis]|uniref:Deoxyribodipyrimidine photo-lyase n=1 Tax=Persicirhabdus sediminis TaxID=454144 RepID=A0A8J7SFZ3_9BACT|nr:deoxyribodipyrimidine photo-lyase [Persicirhabdus sediminis]MBK1789780.1 deoxyribodipyrimidine photo-lyase [Persicirhabdus sediminis]
MTTSPTLLWFRRDLRLADHRALLYAIELGQPIIPVYLHAEDDGGVWRDGAASQWWLHHALEDLASQLESLGSQLTIYSLESEDQLADFLIQLAEETGAKQIVWSRRYEPHFCQRDRQIKSSLTNAGILAKSFNNSLLYEPDEVKNKSGGHFKVFTPFWKSLKDQPPEKPLPSPVSLASLQPDYWPAGIAVSELNLLPSISWDAGFYKNWLASHQGAEASLKKSLSKAPNYQQTRDTPAIDGTSRLSPYLHFGQLSPRELWHSLNDRFGNDAAIVEGITRQLYWREFSAHTHYHFPHSTDRALKPEYDAFPWNYDEDIIKQWQKGETGYPIVDAGMRELWATGWMHNRVRMITASLLVKHLLQPWQEGARWFWDTLVDADLANNSMGWQWVAGCGADASPYFRIFNPIIQGKKFDPSGDYVRKWIPELAQLPNEYIHEPWTCPPLELISYGVQLDKDYPNPIIDHQKGRQQALDALAEFKSNR